MANPFDQLEAAAETMAETLKAQIDLVNRELAEWKLRALAAEDALQHRAAPLVLIRGDWKPKSERKNGYAVLTVRDVAGGGAVALDPEAVLMCCLALGIPAGRQ